MDIEVSVNAMHSGRSLGFQHNGYSHIPISVNFPRELERFYHIWPINDPTPHPNRISARLSITLVGR